MAFTLYFHPLSSFCWKALIALYEYGVPFEPVVVDLGGPASRAAFLKLWPIGKFPVLGDDARQQIVPESTIIFEYLAQHVPSAAGLLPKDAELARQARASDRMYDLYLHLPMQKVVGDRLRPADKKDPLGVEQAQATMRTAYALLEAEMATRTWALGDTFSMADCAAAPALYYGELATPFRDTHPNLARYLDRLQQRPSFARVLREAEPHFHLYPKQ
jgi:glutathione S-transferase